MICFHSHMYRSWRSLPAPIYADTMFASTCIVLQPTDGSKFEEKVCAHTTATTCSSYYSYSSILILLFIFLVGFQHQGKIVLIVHILLFLFFCSYSLVGFQHQGKKILETEQIWLIQEQSCGFLLDEIISPGGEFYASLSSVLVTGATTGKGTSQTNKEASGSKDQASGNKQNKLC
jgi:hypothetical protein